MAFKLRASYLKVTALQSSCAATTLAPIYWRSCNLGNKHSHSNFKSKGDCSWNDAKDSGLNFCGTFSEHYSHSQRSGLFRKSLDSGVALKTLIGANFENLCGPRKLISWAPTKSLEMTKLLRKCGNQSSIYAGSVSESIVWLGWESTVGIVHK